jgi:hypothetical protein
MKGSVMGTAPPTIIEPREGMLLKLPDTQYETPRGLFILTAACSTMLGNKPVHCAGLMPGVSLSIHVQQPAPLELEEFTESLWTQFQPYLEAWIEVAERFPCLTVPIHSVAIALGLDQHIALDKGVMQIEVISGWDGRTDAYAAAGP